MIANVREQGGLLSAVSPAIDLLEGDIAQFVRVAIHLCNVLKDEWGVECPVLSLFS
jgi:hypothetical protein